jgi:hypothetical protein
MKKKIKTGVRKLKSKFKHCEAIVFDPSWKVENYPDHPLKRGQVVYFLGNIPNRQGHCIVVTYGGDSIPMVHPGDFRKAKEEEV